MARMLNSNDSVSRCLNTIRRHQRLIKQVVNDQKLAQQIQDESSKLQEKATVVGKMETAREDAYDDLILADRNLDDFVRTIYEKCKQHDRDNLSDRVLVKVFPDETFGDIIRLPFSKEVNEVRNIAARLKSLGDKHLLYPLAQQLLDMASASNKAIKATEVAINDQKLAEAEMEIAKESLILKYEINYLDFRKKYGRQTAEKLFPKVYNRSVMQKLEEELDEESYSI